MMPPASPLFWRHRKTMPSSYVPYKEFTSKYILEQYKNSPRLRGLIDAILTQCDDIEIAFHEIFQSLDPFSAVGSALDYIGKTVGVTRTAGESDTVYRARIFMWRDLNGIPTAESLRRALGLFFYCNEVGLYPCWPAGIYFVLYGDYDQSFVGDLSDYYPSGVDVAQGTFLCCEDGETYGLLLLDDNEQPVVIDQRWPDTEYELVDDNGNYLVDDEGNHLVALDFLTT